MTRFITVISGKGGVGKTTTVINLGTALTMLNKDTLVLDANLTAPNLGLYLGINNPPATLHEILNQKNKPEEATYLHASGLKIIPGSIKLNALDRLNINNLKKLPNQLNGLSEITLIDTGAGLTKETVSVMSLADEAIIVTNPELAAVTDALKTIKKAEEQNILVLGVVLNRMQETNEISVENIQTMLDSPIIASIPESSTIKQAQAIKHPVVYSYPNSSASFEFKKLAEKLK